jgi:hypothetical protein
MRVPLGGGIVATTQAQEMSSTRRTEVDRRAFSRTTRRKRSMSTARSTRSWKVAVGAATAALTLVGLSAPALAKPLVREHFQDSSSEVVEEFCGDLTVRIDREVTGTFLLNPQGRNRLAYATENVRETFSVTNLATGKSYTSVSRVTFRDLKVTDNGDGTLTIPVLATGSEKWYGPDGKFLFNNAGQVRFKLLIDHSGTPTDPDDDEFLAFLGVVKDSTGRNDTAGRDFCDDVHEFTG